MSDQEDTPKGWHTVPDEGGEPQPAEGTVSAPDEAESTEEEAPAYPSRSEQVAKEKEKDEARQEARDEHNAHRRGEGGEEEPQEETTE